MGNRNPYATHARVLLREIQAQGRPLDVVTIVVYVVLSLVSLVLVVIPFLVSLSGEPSPGVFLGLGFGLLLAISAYIVYAYIIYRLVKDLNYHTSKTLLLYTVMLDALEEAGYDAASLARLRMLVNQARFERKERDPLLWTLLVVLVLGILALYVLHFVNKDYWKHQFYESQFLDEVSRLTGVKFHYYEAIPNRNTVLYAVLTILTLGIFEYYWIYVAAKDADNHHGLHARINPVLEELLDMLEEKSGTVG